MFSIVPFFSFLSILEIQSTFFFKIMIIMSNQSIFFFRMRESELIRESNGIADQLLCSAKDFIVQNEYREIFTPNYDIIFRGKPTSISLGNVRTSHGDLKDLSTLNRHKSWSNDKEMTFFGTFSLKEFKVSEHKHCFHHNFIVIMNFSTLFGSTKPSMDQPKFLEASIWLCMRMIYF